MGELQCDVANSKLTKMKLRQAFSRFKEGSCCGNWRQTDHVPEYAPVCHLTSPLSLIQELWFWRSVTPGCIQREIFTIASNVVAVSPLPLPYTFSKRPIHSQLKWAILLIVVIRDGKNWVNCAVLTGNSARLELSLPVVFHTQNCAVHSGNPTVSSVYLPTPRWHHLKAHIRL
jgi:hypothetical protein